MDRPGDPPRNGAASGRAPGAERLLPGAGGERGAPTAPQRLHRAGSGVCAAAARSAAVSVYSMMHLSPNALGALFIGYICQNMHVYKELMIHIKLMTL